MTLAESEIYMGWWVTGEICVPIWQCFLLHTRRWGAEDGLWWPSEHGVSMMGYDDPQKARCWWRVMMTLRIQDVDDSLWWPPEGEVLMTGYDDPQNTGCRWRVTMTPRSWGADDGLWWPLSNDNTSLFPTAAFWGKFFLESYRSSLSVLFRQQKWVSEAGPFLRHL